MRINPMGTKNAQEALHLIMDGEALTQTASIAGDTYLIDRACWMFEAGRTLDTISDELGLPEDDVLRLVRAAGCHGRKRGAGPPKERPRPTRATVRKIDWDAILAPCWWSP